MVTALFCFIGNTFCMEGRGDMLTGVYEAVKKNGERYYRASFTYRNKHISLGSFETEEAAHTAYILAGELTTGEKKELPISAYGSEGRALSFEKWVVLINFRDNGMYIKNPIYLKSRYFIYYYNEETQFKFDVDDLFYYSEHKIMKRGGHLFVADYGMQVNILSRYGIKNHAVCGRDYRFVNGDNTDFRYGNMEVINRYYGVIKEERNGTILYTTRIHIVGDVIVGRYETEEEAAVAYNCAADILEAEGAKKAYPRNYIEGLSSEKYKKLYQTVSIVKKNMLCKTHKK